jgi:GxxExxY protein
VEERLVLRFESGIAENLYHRGHWGSQRKMGASVLLDWHGCSGSVSPKPSFWCRRVCCHAGPFFAWAGLAGECYQACLVHELRKRGLDVASQVGLPVVYDGEKIELGYRIDLIVETLVIVEVKCVEAIHPVHQAQLLSYMRLSGIAVGLLINFYVDHLRDGIKRMVDGRDWEK